MGILISLSQLGSTTTPLMLAKIDPTTGAAASQISLSAAYTPYGNHILP